MIAVLLVALVVCAGAAPMWRDHHSHLSPFDGSLERHLNKQMFDINRLQDELRRDLNRETMQIETMISDFSRHFPSMQSTEGIEGNEYKITIPLTGFDEKEITVNARKGLLTIQAHNENNNNNYRNVRALPVYVGDGVSWSYENGLLKIVLAVVQSADNKTKELTPKSAAPEVVTERPTFDTDLNTDIDFR